jgi:DNA-binding HxlR family transcriptional regulator
MTSVAAILHALSHEDSILLLETIAVEKTGVTDVLRTKTKLSSKQYYSRMSMLVDAGLVKRRNKKHHLTAIGKVVYGIMLLLEDMISDQWRLKVTDTLEVSNELTNEERNKVINTLIDMSKIKSILSKPILEYDELS